MALISQIPKNSREEFRVSRDDFQGHDLINIRVFFISKDGEMLPGKQGVAFKAELLPEFIDALSKVEAA
ncbi:transcriptional coactivator p15/PC4 family protein [Ruegeria sp. HKCCA6707]|uniref:transcriptional coactivator p15/PC4 family protein n=1 Tax=Ruegeria sp. HKCCA6707 TaxID=2682996 RepID=UPI0014879F52|nr:transcriptional coactivator p15/PC4 family protein [Ruegeria sp. HKCCA6707]